MKLLAPNGKPSNLTPKQYKIVRTPAFKKWFGDWENPKLQKNMLLDENKEPKIFWHYGNNDWNKIKKYTPDPYTTGKIQGRIFLSPTKNSQWYYWVQHDMEFEKKTSGKLVDTLEFKKYYFRPFFVKSEKIRKLSYEQKWKKQITNNKNEVFRVDIKPNKYLEKTYKVKIDDYFVIVTTPSQIKLADGKNTTFNSKNPDIRYAGGGEVLIAPNGKPSNLTPEQYKLVRTAEFKAWFGDWENDSKNASKVVDENGEPLVVYHGTNYKWKDEQGNVVPEMRGFGLHLGTLKAATDRVKSFTMNINPHIKELFVNARNILHLSRDYRFHDSLTKVSTELYKDGIISKEEKNKFIRVYSDEATFDNLRKLLIEKYGFNGITYRNNIEDRGSLSYIIFNPNQIKLADGTNTTFDSNNPDIRFEKGGYIRAIKKIYKDGDEYVYGGKFGLKGTINWKYNPKNNYLYLMGIERNTDKSVGEGTKAINYLFELYPKINKIIFEIDNDEDKNIWKFYDKIGATEEGGGKLNINSFFAELKREDKRFSNGGDVFYINSSEYADGGELTLTSEQVENKLGRKLHWWNDDVVTIQGSQYKKVFLKSEYRKI